MNMIAKQTGARRVGALGLAAALVAGVSLSAIAQEERVTQMDFAATLTGDAEVPAVETEATGTAMLTYHPDVQRLEWTVEYEGLSGPATAGHIHGPAGPDENADHVIDFGEILSIQGSADLSSPIEGSTTITPEQLEQLMAGEWYVNIHTEANEDGEIRGQIEPVN